jgi:hypothetical protein
VKKAVPNLGQIDDLQVQQAIRILWDRLQSCQDGHAICKKVRLSLLSQAKELLTVTKDLTRFEARLRG